MLTVQAISQALLLMGGVQPPWNNWTVNGFVPPAASVVLGDPVRPGTFPWGLRVPPWCVRRPQPSGGDEGSQLHLWGRAAEGMGDTLECLDRTWPPAS